MIYRLTDFNNIHILVVEPTASVRMLITDSLRSFGYRNIHSVTSGKEALTQLEEEEIHWIIMPLMANDPVNALQILDLIINEPNLGHTATTLLLDPSTEEYCLPLAFEMGLLSWMPRSYVKENFKSGFEDLFKLLNSNGGNVMRTSAEYIRKFLSEKRMHQSRSALEQNLISCFPGSAQLLLNMAEAEILCGNEARATGLLRQVEILDERLSPACRHMREKYLKNSPETPTFQENTLGIRSVVVIDPDTDVLFAAKEMFGQIGCSDVETFENGAQALEWIIASGKEPDLVIMEWRIPGLSGPILIQRLRQAGFLQVAIIVCSSLIKREEKPLLLEMGVDDILEKPYERSGFFSVIVWALQQNKIPTEQKSLERKFRRLLHASKSSEAKRLLDQLMIDPRADEASKKGLMAEFLYNQNDFKKSCEMAVMALKLGGDSLLLLDVIGKCLLKLNQFEKALQCFEKANNLCSINLERLLTMAEINIKLDRKDEALKLIQSGLAVDSGSADALSAKCSLLIETGALNEAAHMMETLDSVPRIASYINNRAIALARSGRYEESITHYKRAIQCLNPKWLDLAKAVTYNLALAFARYGDYETAQGLLNPLTQNASHTIQRKSSALLKKISRTVVSGQRLFEEEHESPIDLDKQDSLIEQDNFSAEKLDTLMINVTAKRGDLGCYLIFNSVEETAQQARDLVKKRLTYVKHPVCSAKEIDQVKTGS